MTIGKLEKRGVTLKRQSVFFCVFVVVEYAPFSVESFANEGFLKKL